MANTKGRMLFFGIFLFILLISATVYASLPYAECNQMGSASQTHVACNASGGANEDWTDATHDDCEDGDLAGESFSIQNMFVWSSPLWGSHRVSDQQDDIYNSQFTTIVDCPPRRPDGGYTAWIEFWYKIPNIGWEYRRTYSCDGLNNPPPNPRRGPTPLENPEEGTYYVRTQIFGIEDLGSETKCGRVWIDNLGLPVEESVCCNSSYADRDDMSYYAVDFGDPQE